MDLLSHFRGATPEAPAKPAPKPKIHEVFGVTSTAYPDEAFFGVWERKGCPVGDSRDLHRVQELPVRPKPPAEHLQAAIEHYGRTLGKPKTGACDCRARFGRRCADTLKPVQAWALAEMEEHGGLLGPIGVGYGKTLLDLLAPMVVTSCRVAVLLIPPGLRDQLNVDWEFYGQHWNLPNRTDSRWHTSGRPWVHVVAFSELSGPKSTDLLERIQPDLVIVDEAHNLRRRDAARTKRFLRYFVAHPETRLCCWSGTLTNKSLRDYAMLSTLALKDGSPAPLHWPTVEEWAGALDPSDNPAPIGALKAFCEPGESVRVGWKRRLHNTAGVVASLDEQSCNASITFSERPTTLPSKVATMLAEVREKWERPDGEKLVLITDKARCLDELASGFFYRWKWPRGEPVEVIEKWLRVRKEWHKELRERLKFSRPHMDSPRLLTNAAIRFQQGYEGDLPTWDSAAWPEWSKTYDTAKPETEAVWVDDWLARDAAEWAKSNIGIVWFEHVALGHRVAELAGVPYYGAGKDAEVGILRERGERSVVASIAAHGTGRNLQSFSRNLVANVPSDGGRWEQLLGRTHREGQEADEIAVEVYRHTPELILALDKARSLSEYIEGTMGGTQKLLRASYLW